MGESDPESSKTRRLCLPQSARGHGSVWHTGNWGVHTYGRGWGGDSQEPWVQTCCTHSAFFTQLLNPPDSPYLIRKIGRMPFCVRFLSGVETTHSKYLARYLAQVQTKHPGAGSDRAAVGLASSPVLPALSQLVI